MFVIANPNYSSLLASRHLWHFIYYIYVCFALKRHFHAVKGWNVDHLHHLCPVSSIGPRAAGTLDSAHHFSFGQLAQLPWQCASMNLGDGAFEGALKGGVYLFGC